MHGRGRKRGNSAAPGSRGVGQGAGVVARRQAARLRRVSREALLGRGDQRRRKPRPHGQDGQRPAQPRHGCPATRASRSSHPRRTGAVCSSRERTEATYIRSRRYGLPNRLPGQRGISPGVAAEPRDARTAVIVRSRPTGIRVQRDPRLAAARESSPQALASRTARRSSVTVAFSRARSTGDPAMYSSASTETSAT